MTRQHPSLDVIAAQRAARRSPTSQTPALPTDANPSGREDSRSSSSESSPAPADNEESDFFFAAEDSESSLGMPNLQDMRVADDECSPPINRLPNEILIGIFSRLSQSSDILHCMLTCKRWARYSVDILWHRPGCSTWKKHSSICLTLGLESPCFAYREFIRRLNLAALADKVNDGSVLPLAVCNRVERLTLTNCRGLTDSGLIALVHDSRHLLALDISNDEQITQASIYAIAEECKRLQGLNISNCLQVSNESLITLAESCRFMKRIKLNDCRQLTDAAVLAFAEHCPNILEIDLHQCRLVGNESVTALLTKGQSLRELRLGNCELIDDDAFLSLPPNRTYEHLRILDLTSCARLTDRAVERIVDAAPRLRNICLAKCRNITDAAAYALSRLGRNLQFIHLGHCGHLTDDAVKRLVQCCNRIRYIDLGCCVHLTDESVSRLATLPKLKRIGLVKCANITDDSICALARANQRLRPRRDTDGLIMPGEHYTSSHSSLERVHLSYCTNLTLKGIIRLLNACPRITHLSLTGVQAFLREDLEAFCRDAPQEFTEQQRQVFCVFSGQGVIGLRRYLNESEFAHMHDPAPGEPRRRPVHAAFIGAANGVPTAVPIPAHGNGAFDEGDPDVVDDEDALDEGSEMAVDTQPLLGNNPAAGLGFTAPHLGVIPPPPPPPPPPPSLLHLAPFHVPSNSPTVLPQSPAIPSSGSGGDEAGGANDGGMSGPSDGGASTAFGRTHHISSSAPRSQQASGAGPLLAQVGPSTASAAGEDGSDSGGGPVEREGGGGSEAGPSGA